MHLWVIIVDDPEKGIVEGNLIEKKTGERCKHLLGDESGTFECAVHDCLWYEECPCFSYGQIEQSADCVCRMGEYILGGHQDLIQAKHG